MFYFLSYNDCIKLNDKIGTWVQKAGGTDSVATNSEVGITLYPSSGKKIVAIGAMGAAPNNSWNSILMLKDTSLQNAINGAYVGGRTLTISGSGATQAYTYWIWVLEKDI